MPLKEDEATLAALAQQSGNPDPNPDPKPDTEPDLNPDTDPIVVNDPDPDPKPGEESDPDPKLNTDPKPDPDPVAKSLADAGYSDDDLKNRLIKDKGISDEFINELKDKIDPDFVDAHVARLRAEYKLVEYQESEKFTDLQAKRDAVVKMNDYIFQAVGGKEKFEAMGKTLKESLDDTEVQALNAKLLSGNKTVVKEALQDAAKKYNKIRGLGGKLMDGDVGGGQEPAAHITKEEYRLIMRSDKYKTDPKYAAKIDKERLDTRAQDSKKYGVGQYYGFHPMKGRYAL